MTFAFPGWRVGWFTPFILLLCVIGGWSALADAEFVIAAILAIVGVCCCLIWLAQRWAVFPIIAIMCLLVFINMQSVQEGGLTPADVILFTGAVYIVAELVLWWERSHPSDSSVDVERSDETGT
ncbi:MAG: hypothetical protein AAFU85_26750 [Planctomycetota bacterium]